jgi:sporulation protein YunB
MHKIYSRKRIRLPCININGNGNNKYLKKGIKVLCILMVALGTFNVITNAVNPVFDTLCKEKARSIATLITNEQATNVMREHSYDELFSIEKDESGNITMIKSNVFPINEIISDVAIKIQEEINSTSRSNVKIALGTFTGIKLLSGRGPYVNIKISSIGNVETDLRSEFTAQGINQTLHRVYLQVECDVSILTPFNNTEEKIANQVLIAENVIVGEIPDTYYNLNGIDSSEGMDLLQ